MLLKLFLRKFVKDETFRKLYVALNTFPGNLNSSLKVKLHISWNPIITFVEIRISAAR